MLPPGHRVVGLRQADGIPHVPARKIGSWADAGPSDVEKYEKPGEVASTFFLVDPATDPVGAGGEA
jgi:hypothetical protein